MTAYRPHPRRDCCGAPYSSEHYDDCVGRMTLRICTGPSHQPGCHHQRKRVYIAGPMTGIADFNYPAFNAAAAAWRERGWHALNPAEHDLTFAHEHVGEHDLIRAHYMRLDLDMVVTADAIALLPGWQRSKGAQLEVHVAKVLGIPLLDALTFEAYSESALEEAQRLVHGDRGADYGHPADDFARTGRMWGAILGIPDVAPELVGLCMAAVKISREVNAPKRDNRVDLAGYAETVQMIHERRGAP